jgi:glutamate synthase domain-containing protein 3
MQQLSLFPELAVRQRIYVRDRTGKFATKEQRDVIQATRLATNYKLLYEAERRKLKPIIKRLVEVERELNELKIKKS